MLRYFQVIMIINAFVSFLFLFPTEVKAYNRALAVAYAASWAMSFNEPTSSNPNAPYENLEAEGGDCSNFVSQCLIAGGFRFRGSYNANDNYVPFGPANLVAELGEGPHLTRGIHDHNITKYSRILPRAIDNVNSLTVHHDGKQYIGPELETGYFWDDVQEGDVIYQSWLLVYHCMFVHTVTSRTAKTLNYSAHTNPRLNEPITKFIPNWKINCQTICLPDAPIVQKDYVKVFNDGHEISWYWRDKSHRAGPKDNWIKAKNKPLEIQFTFDTAMDVEKIPEVYLWWRFLHSIRFEPITGSGWSDTGWWMMADNVSTRCYQRRTWRGVIESGIPLEAIMGIVNISACAPDGSTNDASNDISEYNAATHFVPMSLIKISFDPKGALKDDTNPQKVPWEP